MFFLRKIAIFEDNNFLKYLKDEQICKILQAVENSKFASTGGCSPTSHLLSRVETFWWPCLPEQNLAYASVYCFVEVLNQFRDQWYDLIDSLCKTIFSVHKLGCYSNYTNYKMRPQLAHVEISVSRVNFSRMNMSRMNVLRMNEMKSSSVWTRHGAHGSCWSWPEWECLCRRWRSSHRYSSSSGAHPAFRARIRNFGRASGISGAHPALFFFGE